MIAFMTADTVPLTEAPAYQKETYILTGYRKSITLYDPIQSLIRLHNETVNIWSHIFGFWLFTALLPLTVSQLDNVKEQVIFLLYIIPCMELFAASACYHLFKDQSERARKMWQKIDHLSIIFLLWGSDMPMICYGFWSFPCFQIIYIVAVTILVTCVALILTSNEMQAPHLAIVRYTVFVGTCAVGWMQLMHEMWLKGWSSPRALEALGCWGKAFGTYLLGFVFFISRVPEALFPVTFDLIGASHQIWHVLIVIAATVHLDNCWVYRSIALNIT